MDFGELRVTYVGDPRPAVRAATEVDRVHRQTARSAEANDRLVERSARQLAQVRSREAKRAADDFIRELERMRRAEQQGGAGGGLRGELSTLTGGRLAFAGGGAVAGVGALAAGFIAAAKAGVEYKGTIDKLTRSFESLLGSSSAANRHLAELREFANRTPFEFEDVARASQRFQAMGIESAKVIPLLQDMGNAVASVGGGKDELDRVALAIAQINAKGRVMSQEMNQLSEVGISGWKALTAETGKSRAELMKMVEAGEVSAETFNKAFNRMYGSSNAMQKQMETLGGATSTLKDATKLLLADAFTPLHNILRDTAVELAKISTEGFNAERGLTAAASVFRSGFNMANLGGGDNLLMALAYQQGGPQLAAAVQALLRGAQPGQKAAGQGGGINIPDQFKYQPRISDEDLAVADKRLMQEAFARRQREEEEAQRKARQENERQSDVLKRIAQDYAETSTRVSGFTRDSLQLEAALYKLSIGFRTLSEENQKLAQAEINRLFSAKRAEQYLKAADDLQKTLNAFVDTAQEDFRGGKTNVDMVTEALAAFVDTGAQADDTMRKLTASAMQLAISMDYGDQLVGFVENMRTLSGVIRDAPLEPGKVTGNIPTPGNLLDLSNVKEDHFATLRETWRENMEHMREDGAAIFEDMFMRIGEGWRSMVGGLVLDFAQSLQQMAAQALANQVWGAILSIAGSALGAAFGPKLPMAGASKMGGSYLQPSAIPGRATGGPVEMGVLYRVNEVEDEFFRPNTGGEVIPLSKMGGRGQRPTVINNTTIINYQPRNVPNSVTSRRSTRESFEALLAFAR